MRTAALRRLQVLPSFAAPSGRWSPHFAALNAGFCNGPWFVNPMFPLARVLSPGSCFCSGSARGRHLMGSEEDKAGQSTLCVVRCHDPHCGLTLPVVPASGPRFGKAGVDDPPESPLFVLLV